MEDVKLSLQQYLIDKFKRWSPAAPEVVNRSKGHITLTWPQGNPFGFLGDYLIYRLEKNNKLPKWIAVYSGGKTTKTIDYLAPRHPHKFRLKIILKSSAIPQLATLATQHYGDEDTVYKIISDLENRTPDITNTDKYIDHEASNNSGEITLEKSDFKTKEKVQTSNISDVVEIILNERKHKSDNGDDKVNQQESSYCKKWIESQWSEETWTNTDTDGTSSLCFCMAVKCGYLKQVQSMVEERPDLINIVNINTGLTPLATAVRAGNINIVRLLANLGTEVDQRSATGQTALHLAVLAADLPLLELLLERGANDQARDRNGLRIEHYAVDSCNLDMLRFVLDRGGDLHAKDYNGWTPLFRALCQGANTEIIEELVRRGSDVTAVDAAGLPLLSVAKLLKNRQGRPRGSVLRLLNHQYHHSFQDKALANFTRISKKIYHANTFFKIN